MKKLVIYHMSCVDGGAAAAAHALAYERSNKTVKATDHIDYVAMGYGTLENKEEFTSVILGYHNVTFLDFCPTKERLSEMLSDGINVTIIDHHKTAYEMIEQNFTEPNPNLHVIFSKDNKLSGATLTWLMGIAGYGRKENTKLREVVIHDHLFLTNVNIGFILEDTIKHKDRIYELIGIRDTWDESRPEMKEKADHLHAYLDFMNCRSFAAIYQLLTSEDFSQTLGLCIEKGKMITEVNKRTIEAALKECHKSIIKTAEGDIHLAIGSCPSGQGSMFGEIWRHQNPGKKTIAVALYFGFVRKSLVLGLRSANTDALRLAKSFVGGGGHSNACGCRMTTVELPFGKDIINPEEFMETLVEDIERRINKEYGSCVSQDQDVA